MQELASSNPKYCKPSTRITAHFLTLPFSASFPVDDKGSSLALVYHFRFKSNYMFVCFSNMRSKVTLPTVAEVTLPRRGNISFANSFQIFRENDIVLWCCQYIS